MLEYHISGAPVVDEQGLLAGILSEAGCLRSIVILAWGSVVGDCMTRQVETIGYDADIIAVAKIFTEQGRRRLPAVHRGKLAGQISRCDVLRAVRRLPSQGRPTYRATADG